MSQLHKEVRKEKIMRFVLVSFWVVCVFNFVHAADLDENTPLLMPSAVRSHLALSFWEAKIDQVLKEEGQAWVVSLPARGGQYSVTCDLQQETVRSKYTSFGRKCRTIEPYIKVLGDEFLGGLRVNPANIPTQMEVDFGLKNVDLRNCTQDRFFSEVLRNFLCRDLCRLEKKGKVSFDNFAEPLTKDLRQVMPPRSHRLRWIFSSRKDLLAAVQKETRDTTSVFVVVGGHGVLKGEMERSKQFSSREIVVLRDSLLSYKMLAVWQDLHKKYPFSPESYKHCINYKPRFFERFARRK